jgi:outer membrane biosynthesis protein TonB
MFNPAIAGPALAEKRSLQDRNVGAGFAASAFLHGLAALLLLLLIKHGHREPPVPPFRIVPVDMVQLGEETASPAQPLKALAPQERAAPRPKYNPVPSGIAPDKQKPVPDELESKLRTLSKLRAPPSETPLENDETGASNVSAESDGAKRGPHATYSMRDYIRAQVERRWSLDLNRLGNRDVAIPIRIEITSRGVVTKAEIVESARAAKDKIYRDVAISARNAVLLSSPIELPSGRYESVMELTLLLNPKDTLR